MSVLENKEPRFRIVGSTKPENQATGTTLEFEYVDRAGESQRFYETIYGHKDELRPPEHQAASQLLKRLEVQLNALREFSDQFLAHKFPPSRKVK